MTFVRSLVVLAFCLLNICCASCGKTKPPQAFAKQRGAATAATINREIHLQNFEAALRMSRDTQQLNATDEEGVTPLAQAATDGYHEFIKSLIGAGANVNEKNEHGMTAVMFAAAAGNAECVKVLVQAGAKCRDTDENGVSVIDFAIIAHNPETIKAILESGVAIEQVNGLGLTPLMSAVVNSNETIVKLLLESGANCNASNGNLRVIDYARDRVEEHPSLEASQVYDLIRQRIAK